MRLINSDIDTQNSMWIRNIERLVRSKTWFMYPGIVNLAEASAVTLWENGSKWQVKVHFERYNLTLARTSMLSARRSDANRAQEAIAIYSVEQEAKDAVLQIATRLRNYKIRVGQQDSNGGLKDMWIKSLESHPFDKNFEQVQKLINLSTASGVSLFRDRTKKWHVGISHRTGFTSIGLFDTEAEAREALDKIALKLGAVSSIDEL